MPVVVLCSFCKQRSRVMEDMVGKPVRCPTCGKDFVARAEATTAVHTPAAPAPAPLIKKTGVKTNEIRPSRKNDSWTDLEAAPASDQPAARSGGLLFLWLA